MAMTELELKFSVLPERLQAVRDAMVSGAAAAGQGAQRQRLQAHYFDTPDGALGEARLALRLRKEGRRWVQTLKAQGASHLHRLEHEVELPTSGPGVPPLDPARHHGTEAGDLLEAALRRAGTGLPPLPRYGTDVRRRRLLVEAGGGQVEIALDEGCILAGEQDSLPIREIEFELKSGEPAAMFEVAEAWRAEHGLVIATASKAERGERLAAGIAEAPPVKAGTPRVDDAMDGPALLRAVVASCVGQIAGNAAEVASGRFDDDHVHQLRIGIRRLRTVLRELGRLSGDVDPAWEAPLVAAFQVLGEYRDRDEAAGAVQPQLRAAGAPEVDWPAPQGEVPDPAEAARAQAFQRTLLALLRFTHIAEPAQGADAKAARGLVVRRLRRLHRQVFDDGRRFETLDEASQHRVRKRLKRLRYLAECTAPLFGERRVERWLKHLRPAQDALGAHNDAHVAHDLYREAAGREPKAWFAVGWLQSQLHGASAAACRRALKKAGGAKTFWKG